MPRGRWVLITRGCPGPYQAGFTLLEVLVATLIMGIAVAGILGGMAGIA